MSSSELTFFVLGATGYIGGAVAIAYKKAHPSASFVAFTRTASRASALESIGLRPLTGTGDATKDLELIKNEARKADVVVNCADCDDVVLTKTILEALESSEKRMPILIHTSGTGVLIHPSDAGRVDASGAPKIYDDANVDDIKSLHPQAWHRPVDLAIFEAAAKEHSINYIITPSTIYGVAHENPVHKTSIQIPDLIRAALRRKQAIFGGDGTNEWNNVHIADCVDLYLIVLAKALAERNAPLHSTTVDPFERFYFASVRTHIWGDVVRAIAKILHRRGVLPSSEAVGIPTKEAPYSSGGNSRSVANRGFADGWKPSRPRLEETLEEDVEAILREEGLVA